MIPKRDRSGEYLRRKAKCLQLNICFRCGQPKGQNKWLCDGCLEKTNIIDRQRRKKRAIINQCDCGRPSVPDGRLCTNCLEIARLFQEQRRKQHRQKGTCLTCGANLQSGQTTCIKCNSRATKSTLERYHQNIASKTCAFCGNRLNKSAFRCDRCHAQHITHGKLRWHKERRLVIDHYGNKCVCCGETIIEFLEVDHINNNGKSHRKITGSHICSWIIRHNYPTDLQLLCSKCNHGRARFEICPHQRTPSEPISKGARRRRHQRRRVIEHYGNICACCGESNWAFLEFDHSNDDGAEHRKQLGKIKLISWIIANNYPDTIQLLCSNCNKAKGLYGTCPHQLSNS